MLPVALQNKTIDNEVLDYINTIKTDYERQIKTLQFEYLLIKEKLDILLYKQFGRSSEKLQQEDEKQQQLFTKETANSVEKAETEKEFIEVKSFKRKKGGRKTIDPEIERRERIIDISESEKICVCGAKLSRIGEEISEKLHITQPEIYVERIVRPKYACRHCEGVESEGIQKTVRMAPVEPTIIPKSIVTPSLLSHIIISKYEDHLPYFRQEKQFERMGVTISRQDMCNWQLKAFQNLSPLFDLLKEAVKSGSVIQMDETTMQVMGEEGRSDTQKSYMWLARGGPPGKIVTWYEYHETRGGDNAREFLSGYTGYLQTDGYEGYDSAIKDKPGIIHVGCFAHARRYFYEASKINKNSKSAEEGIKHIRKLYFLERELRDQKLNDEVFLKERKIRAGPILTAFKQWLLKRKDEIPPTIKLGQAINYSLAQWNKLTAYLESPYLTPDNNACENAIRPFVLGRKNWMFNKSPEGADSSCGMFTLIETAKQNGIEPKKYIMAVFEKAPYADSPEDWKKLLPWYIFNL
jgi:transposase